MANCNICGRKESKKRVICEKKVCSECLRKLEDNNYVLVNSNEDNEEALSVTSVISEQNHLLQKEFNDEENDILRIKRIIKECLMEVNDRHNNAISILNNHVKYLQNDIEHKNTLINDLLDGLRNINKINNMPTEKNNRARDLRSVPNKSSIKF